MTRIGCLVCLVAAVLAGLIYAHVDPLSGPYYWRRPWYRLDVAGVVAMSAVLALYCGVCALILKRERLPLWIGLTLVSCSLMLSMVCAATTQRHPWGNDRLADLIQSPRSTGYFTDATRAPDDWFARYHLLSPTAMMHTSTKPAGPVLFYRVMLGLTGGDHRASALIGGYVLILVAGLGVPVTYWAAREITRRHSAALVAAMVAAGASGSIVSVSQLDPAYVALSGVLIAGWARAMRTGSWAWAAASGLALSVALFFAFQLLVLGLFMLVLPFVTGLGGGRLKQVMTRVFLMGAVFVGVVFASHLLLYVMTGYNSVMVFAVAQQNQAEHLKAMPARIAPWTAGWDLYDYILGLGWSVVVPLLMSLVLAWRERELRYAWVMGVQLFTIAVFALMPAETARVWMFLIPITAPAIGDVASRWAFADRLCLFIGIAVSTLAVHANMVFMVP